jgi:uncharacterized protein YodC (DUF2158 family)
MTVSAIDDYHRAQCCWFTDGGLSSAAFSAEALMPAPTPDHDEDDHEDEYE